MLDIGLGEVALIAVLALLVFGPDRLPKVAADAARTLRQVRQLATSARKDLADAAGLDADEELAGAVRDLDPRRLFTADPPAPAPRAGAAPVLPAPGLPASAPPASGPRDRPPADAAAPAPAAPAPAADAGGGVAAGSADPDWT